jgi:hypothetical protein
MREACIYCGKVAELNREEILKHRVNDYVCSHCKKVLKVQDLLESNCIDADLINDINDEVFFAILRSRGYSGQLIKSTIVNI